MIIGIVTTCHNRIDKSVKCIKSLLHQTENSKVKLKLFLCDDGSTDGTADAIKTIFPSANIVHGTGNLFWAKGICEAMEVAGDSDCDFYLIINDDVEFYDTMIKTMIDCYYMCDNWKCAIVGSTRDKETGLWSYGGISRNGKVSPTSSNKECEHANWNCFLMHHLLYKTVGKIDRKYEHAFADYDYSNRIRSFGGKIIVANEYVGACSRNKIDNTWMDAKLPIVKRIKLLNKPNGLPVRSVFRYYFKYDKKKLVYIIIYPYLAIVKSHILYKINWSR